ncbi:GNAT family N-acetyltransferase [Streptomyces monticola]|uniref:GNAT family N-acetyltransferase n=1 Tax=Streptomyces monticola TaxID=2666263 RepID=A0ABW2JLG4_9ACTN
MNNPAPGWHFTGDPEVFTGRAAGFLDSDPVTHTALLTVTDTLRTRGLHVYGDRAPLFGDFTDSGGTVIGAFVWTPTHHVMLSPLPAGAAAALAGHLSDQDLSGVGGEHTTAEAFAAAWSEQTGAVAEVETNQCLYRLEMLTPPMPAPPGRARIATRADRGLVMRWYTEFKQSVGADTGMDPADWADARLSYSGIMLWEVEDEDSDEPGAYTPVAFAGCTRPVAGQIRIAPVYTPRELRGRGYAAAVTAEISRAARAAGADEVLLFTDLANPTSNGLYQRVGYRPVRDFTQYAFTATAAE